MSLTKYYKILGLQPGADQAAVRKAYRRLAMMYHPDKNPIPSAQAKFIVITEAYEILTGKKQAPVQRVSRANRPKTHPARQAGNTERMAKTQADRVREAKKRQEEQRKREFIENERYFQQLTTGWKWKLMRISAMIGVILAIALVTERFLPKHYTTDKVTHYSLNPGITKVGDMISVVDTELGNTYWISQMSYTLYGIDPAIYVESSWIFHEPERLISIGKIAYTPFEVHYTFSSFYLIVALLFMLPLLTILIKDRTVTFTIFYQMSFYGVNFLMLYFLFRNDHWAHLLTLGYL